MVTITMIRSFDSPIGGEPPKSKGIHISELTSMPTKESPFEIGFSDDGKKVLLTFPNVAVVEFTLEGAADLKKALNDMLPPSAPA